jgi:hypothetical protein
MMAILRIFIVGALFTGRLLYQRLRSLLIRIIHGAYPIDGQETTMLPSRTKQKILSLIHL